MTSKLSRTYLSPLRIELIALLTVEGQTVDSIASKLELDRNTVRRAIDLLIYSGQLPADEEIAAS